MKAGFYNNHSFKAQNTGAGGLGVDFAGSVNFGNDTNNPLDTGFGYANALVGVFTQYRQASVLIEGNMLYNNTEFYLQDNWKVNGRLTLDYGMRFTRQQPQYDSKGNMSNFFPDKWSLANAPLLYVPGCSNGAVTCSGNTLNAKNPATGAILTAAGAANTQAAIGTPVIGTGSLSTNGIIAAGKGISKYSYTWPTLVLGPRVGAAYDLTGDQSVVVRGGAGLFYDRPDGNTVFSIPLNPPFADSVDLRNSTLQTLGKGLTLAGVPGLSIFQYDAKVPSSVQWNGGVQMALPWSSSLDVSYVGNHGYNRLGNFQAGNAVNLNAVDFGTAYAAAYQDPTKATKSSVPGADALTDNLLRPYRGLANINKQSTTFHDMYHSVQTSFNRRFRNGVQFGVNYTLGISLTGNTGLQQRLQHDYTTGAVSIRDDQAKYEELNKNLNNRRHVLKANWVWDMPDVKSENSALRAVGYVVNDWQLSGILTAGSGDHYDLSFNYQNDGSNKNLTGSPDYGARIKFIGDPGKGCSSNQYAQFNTASVVGPSYFSDGLESGRNIMTGCADHTVDLAIARNIRLGGGRQVQLRLDAFNAFNTVIFSGRQGQIQYVSPTNLTLRNSQTLADGSVDPARVKPQDAGFGAVNGAQTLRNMQLTARFSF
jgi:hypothetical protein